MRGVIYALCAHGSREDSTALFRLRLYLWGAGLCLVLLSMLVRLQLDMDECFTQAVHNLFTACAQDEPTKINEAVSVATIATECLVKEKGDSQIFIILCPLMYPYL